MTKAPTMTRAWYVPPRSQLLAHFWQNNCPMGMRHMMLSPPPSDEQAKLLPGCTTPSTVPAGTLTTPQALPGFYSSPSHQ